MNLVEAIQNNLTESELSQEELKNLYLMDRVLRSMNNEYALSDGWLMNYVADGDSDNGPGYIIQEYKNFFSKDDYQDAYSYYKQLVNKYQADGIISRAFYKNDTVSSGADEEVLAFVKKDFPNIEVIDK